MLKANFSLMDFAHDDKISEEEFMRATGRVQNGVMHLGKLKKSRRQLFFSAEMYINNEVAHINNK